MAAQKKRKLESSLTTDAPVLSAFAARQKLWGSSAVVVPDKSEKDEPPSQISSSSSTPKQIPRNQVPEDRPSPSPESQPGDTPLTAPLSPKPAAVIQHSTFRPDKNRKNYQQKPDGRVLLKLSDGERLVILGSYGLKVREGELTLSGAVLHSSTTLHWVHALSCHALPVIRAAADTSVEIHPHPGAESLQQLSRLNPAFGKLWHETPSGTPSKATFRIIYTSADWPGRFALQELVSPAEWNKQLAITVKSKLKGATPVVFLCGPKSSGKSTFGRILLNRLVTDQGHSKKPWTSVAVLDIDPGQPEYGPPGVISLNKIAVPNLVAPFCHPVLEPRKEQLRAHAIAAISPAHDAKHYVECVLDLLWHYRTKLGSKCPLIINTPGWIQGTGLDILVELVQKVRPTEVIYMSQDGPGETVDNLKAACGSSTPFNTLPSQTGSLSTRTAAEFRTMQTLSYFHLKWSSISSPTPTWDPTPLTALRPWRVRYRGPDPGFVGIMCYDHQPGLSLLADAINGMILALVKIENRAAFRDLFALDTDMEVDVEGDLLIPSSKAIIYTTEGIPLIQNSQGRTLDPKYSSVLGLVLVRGIDAGRGELQILTPLPGDLIAEAGKDLVLVSGKFDTPSWAYSEDLYLRAFTTKGALSGAATPSRAGGETSESGSDDSEEEQGEEAGILRAEPANVPWVEMLHGNQKRPAGSKVWRVRRDLGRN
ncbi:hypothetical protein QBC47DRAFT_395980 [Echria macrotheca]|uniref:Polynucleotide 5'-hydroxyl-kinase GRC3 n=1 Tax=Echria macrotheca TaxID=438768 RepID=A0AAJ0B0C1_9PEZI|nr:hypothetical protein QBC47DRAFT_395980 [Echria macrotheca]